MKNKNIDKDPILYMFLHCETDSCCVYRYFVVHMEI